MSVSPCHSCEKHDVCESPCKALEDMLPHEVKPSKGERALTDQINQSNQVDLTDRIFSAEEEKRVSNWLIRKYVPKLVPNRSDRRRAWLIAFLRCSSCAKIAPKAGTSAENVRTYIIGRMNLLATFVSEDKKINLVGKAKTVRELKKQVIESK